MIKGGGAALTREKIVADMAERFVCIADESKLRRAARPLSAAGRGDSDGGGADRRAGSRAWAAEPVLREGVVTDNGGQILDVRGLAIADPAAMEREINQWPGVVCVRHLRAATRASCACSAPPRACGR